jgi:hypothetical protein
MPPPTKPAPGARASRKGLGLQDRDGNWPTRQIADFYICLLNYIRKRVAAKPRGCWKAPDNFWLINDNFRRLTDKNDLLFWRNYAKVPSKIRQKRGQ